MPRLLNEKNIRVMAALVVSLAVHALLITMNSGQHKAAVGAIARQQRVTLALMPRRTRPNPPPARVKRVEQKPALPIVNKIVREIPAPVRPIASIPESIEPLPIPKPLDDVVVAANEEIESVEPTEQIAEVSEPNRVEDSTTDKPTDRIDSTQAGLFEVIEAQPLYKKNPPPDYPALARKRRFQGTVLLEVLVSEDGEVKDRRVAESSGHAVLDKAALAAVKVWLFTPGSRNGKGLEMWVRVPVRFLLQ